MIASGSNSRAALALTFATALALAPLRAALAQDLTPAQHAEWEKKRDAGRAAAQAEQWNKAREAYQRAWQIKKDWNLAANLGLVDLRQGRYRDAAEHLEYAVREAPPNTATKSPEEWNRLREIQQRALSKVGILVITVDPPGAEVLVNGLPVGRSPLPGRVFVEPGAVAVEARGEGFALGHAQVSVEAGKQEAVRLNLAALPGWAGKRGKEVPAPPPPPVVPGPRVNKGAIIAGATVTGLGVILGGVFAGVSNAKAAQSQDVTHQGNGICVGKTACKPVFDDLQQQKQTFSGVSMWSFIGAGVGAGVLTYGLVTWKKAGSVKATVAPDRVGVSFSGMW